MSLLKQSSTAQPLVFLMVDSTDHVTGKTGLTPTVTLSKSGAAFGSPAGAVTEIGEGWYKVAGNATDTGTLGPLILHATGTAADPVDVLYEVVAFDPQLAAAGALMPATPGRTLVVDASGLADANMVKMGPTGSGAAQTARDIGASVLLSNGTGTGQLKLASGYVAMTWADIGSPTTTVNLSGTTVKAVTDAVSANVTQVSGDSTAADNLEAALDGTGGVTLSVILGAGAIQSGTISSGAIHATAIDTAALRADCFATDCISAAALAADAVTEIQSGLATAAALSTVDDFLDTEIAAIKAKTDNLPAAPAATGDIPTATQNADALLNRDMSAVSDTNARSPLNALRFLRNKWSVSGTTLTVTKEDDTTAAWTSTVTTNASADPITGNDPT